MKISYKDLTSLMSLVNEVRNDHTRLDVAEEGTQPCKVISVPEYWKTPRIAVMFDDDDLPPEELKKFKERFRGI